ncbi:uncharacterized protein DEA37_0011632 [Paragonimus westermani]|uniref:Uncharacterized protein n=1 Tax=Paragonimus westermani TaxID=34504 RepID=A0A5J4NCG6_9TREM|nr:uncharacterized protein DEA37_0011632 [Paragonimus westermani]
MHSGRKGNCIQEGWRLPLVRSRMTDYYPPQQTAPYPTNGSSMPNQPPPPYYPNSNNANIPAQEQFTSDAFSDKAVRRAFIRKVYLILALQLAITLGIVCIFTFVPVVKDGVRRYYWIYYMSYAVFLVTYILLGCFVQCRRRFPMNIICLFVFVSFDSSQYLSLPVYVCQRCPHFSGLLIARYSMRKCNLFTYFLCVGHPLLILG